MLTPYKNGLVILMLRGKQHLLTLENKLMVMKYGNVKIGQLEISFHLICCIKCLIPPSRSILAKSDKTSF